MTASCDKQSNPAAILDTDLGKIVIVFHPDVQNHVDNFLKLCRQGFYEGTTFHRTVPGVMIQGGDPNSRDEDFKNDGRGGPGYVLTAEIRHQHIIGAVASARIPDQENPARNSNGSQFYICLTPQPNLDKRYTVFGYVAEGLDVAHAISESNEESRNGIFKPVRIVTARIQFRP